MKNQKYREMCVNPEQYDEVINFIKRNDTHLPIEDALNACIDQATIFGYGKIGEVAAITTSGLGNKVHLYIRSEKAFSPTIITKESPSVRLTFTPEYSKDGVLKGTLSFWNSEYISDLVCNVLVQKGKISFTSLTEGGVLPHFMGDDKINKMASDMVRVYFDSQTNGPAFLWYTK